jgi:hypothetical protein
MLIFIAAEVKIMYNFSVDQILDRVWNVFKFSFAYQSADPEK